MPFDREGYEEALERTLAEIIPSNAAALPRRGTVVPTRQELGNLIKEIVVDAAGPDSSVSQPLAEQLAQCLDAIYAPLPPAPRSSFTPPAQTIPISGVWLRHIGENMEVLVEVAGDWYLCISEHIGPNETGITYIANAQGIRDWPKEPTHV